MISYVHVLIVFPFGRLKDLLLYFCNNSLSGTFHFKMEVCMIHCFKCVVFFSCCECGPFYSSLIMGSVTDSFEVKIYKILPKII